MQQPDKNRIEIIRKKNLYKKFFCADEYVFRIPKYNGEMSREFTREVLDRGTAAGILLYDPKLDKIVIVEQFRCGAYLNGDYPWIMECVAGINDRKGEDLKDVVIREAFEEAGAKIADKNDIVEMLTYYTSPGGTTETITLYCAKVDSTTLPEFAGLDCECEDIKIKAIDYDQCVQYLNENKFNNGLMIISMQWLMIHKTELLKKWGLK